MKSLQLKGFSARFFYLLAGLLLSLPFSIFLTNLFGLLLFLNTFSVPAKYWKHNRLKTPLPLIYIGFFGMYALSLLWSSDPAEGLNQLGPRIAFLLMPLALAIGSPALQQKHTKRLKQLFTLAVTLAAIYALFCAFIIYAQTGSWYRYYPDGSVHDHLLFYTGLSDPIMHPGYFSVYIGIAFFMVLQQLHLSPQKWLTGTWLLFLIIFLLMLQGRINLIAFGVTFGFYMLITLIKQRRFRLLVAASTGVAALAIAVVLIAPASVKERFMPSLSLDYDLSAPSMNHFSGFTIRLAEWHCANDIIHENFWLGTGISDSKDALLSSYRKNNFVMGIDREFNTHNQYLQTMIATGLIGLSLLLLIFVFLLRAAFQGRDIYFGMIVVYFFLSMITESMLERHWAITLLCSLLLFLGISRQSQAGSNVIENQSPVGE